jgi:hypothetical protein
MPIDANYLLATAKRRNSYRTNHGFYGTMADVQVHLFTMLPARIEYEAQRKLDALQLEKNKMITW